MDASQTQASHGTDPYQIVKERCQEVVDLAEAQRKQMSKVLEAIRKGNFDVVTDAEREAAAKKFCAAMSLITRWFQGYPRNDDFAQPTTRDKQWLLAIALAFEPTAKKDGLGLEGNRLGYNVMLEDANKDPNLCRLVQASKAERQAREAADLQRQASSRGAGPPA